jgi:hypothetical protein
MVVQMLKNWVLERVILKNRRKCKRTVSTYILICLISHIPQFGAHIPQFQMEEREMFS